MTEKEFVKRVFSITDCEKCPLAEFCKITISITCNETARQYYRTHGKERIKWQALENSLQHSITPSF